MQGLQRTRATSRLWPLAAYRLARSRCKEVLGRPSPTLLILEPTLRCNSRCPACYNKGNLNRPGAALDLSELRRIALGLPDLTVLELSGGEPFLYPNLPELVRIFAEATPVRFVAVPTNGLLPNVIEETTRRLCEAFQGFLGVQLSIDGIGLAHDAIRGVEGNFTALCETYERLSFVRRLYPNLHLSANTCVSALNRERYREVMEWVARHWPDVEGHSLSLVRGPGSAALGFDGAAFTDAEFAALAEAASAAKGYRLGLLGRLNSLFWRAYYAEAQDFRKGAARRFSCSAGAGALYIDASGGVHSCELRPPFASLRTDEAPLSELLRSAAAKNERREIAARRCSCDHACFMQHSVYSKAANLYFWRNGLRTFLRHGGRDAAG